MASSSPPPVRKAPSKVVDEWGSETQYYDYGSNTCQAGQQCGHYTQVIWRSTQQVGCGSAVCNRGDGWEAEIWVCQCLPPGNYQGQRPY